MLYFQLFIFLLTTIISFSLLFKFGKMRHYTVVLILVGLSFAFYWLFADEGGCHVPVYQVSDQVINFYIEFLVPSFLLLLLLLIIFSVVKYYKNKNTHFGLWSAILCLGMLSISTALNLSAESLATVGCAPDMPEVQIPVTVTP